MGSWMPTLEEWFKVHGSLVDFLVTLAAGLAVGFIGWCCHRFWKRWQKCAELKAGRYLVSYSDFYGQELDRHKHKYVQRKDRGSEKGEPVTHPVIEQIRDWIKGPQTLLVLFGEAGIGKTRCVIEAAKGSDLRWINLASYRNSPDELRKGLSELVTEGMLCVCDEYQDCREFEKLVDLIIRKKGKLLVVSRDRQGPERAIQDRTQWLDIPLYKMADGTLAEVVRARADELHADEPDRISLNAILRISEGVPAFTVLLVDYQARKKNLDGIDTRRRLLDSLYSDFEVWAGNRWSSIKPILGKIALVRGAPSALLSESSEFFETAILARQIVREERGGDSYYRVQPGILSDHVALRVYFEPEIMPQYGPTLDEFLRTSSREILRTLTNCNQKQAIEILLKKARELDAKTVIDLGLFAYAAFRDIGFVRTNLGDFWTRVSELDDADYYNSVAILLSLISESDEAEKCWTKALDICEREGKQAFKGVIFNSLGLMYQGKNAWDSALGFYEKALRTYAGLGRIEEASGLATTYNNLGSLYANKGDWPHAVEHLTEAIRASHGLGTAPEASLAAAQSRLIMGSISLRTSDLDQALRFYLEAAETFERSGSIEGMAKAYSGLSLTYGSKGDWVKAQGFIDKTFSLPGFFGDLYGIAAAYTDFGQLHQSKSNWQAAENCYTTAKNYFLQLGNQRGIATAYLGLGWVLQGKSDWDLATQAFNDAQEAFKQLKDDLGQAVAELGLGAISHSKADWDDAIKRYHGSLGTFIRLGNKHEEAQAKLTLGGVHESRGDWDTARSLYEAAQKTFEEVRNEIGVALACACLGSVHLRRGEWDQAHQLYQRSLESARRVGNVQVMFQAYIGLGSVCQNIGKWDQAVDVYTEALKGFRDVGDQFGMLNTHLQLGSVYLGSNRWDEALSSYNEALGISGTIGSIDGQALSLSGLASVYSERSEWDRAADSYRVALEVFNNVGARGKIADTQRSLGWIHYRKGDWTAAIDVEKQSLAISQDMGDPFGIAASCHALGSIYYDTGDYLEALQFEERSTTIYRRLNHPHNLASGYNTLAMIYDKQGKPEEAIQTCRIALEIVRKLGDRRLESYILTNMGTAYTDLGQWREAGQHFSEGLQIKKALVDDYGIAWSYGEIGIMHLKSQEYDKAESNLLRSYELFSRLQASADASRVVGHLHSLVLVHRRNGEEDVAKRIEDAIGAVQSH